LEFLRRQGCDVIQGYLASPPVPQEEFAEMLRDDVRLLRRWLRHADPPSAAGEPALAALRPPTPQRPVRREVS
jgi:hypothetical protein